MRAPLQHGKAGIFSWLLLCLLLLLQAGELRADEASERRVLVGLNLFPNILSVTRGGALDREEGVYRLLVVYRNEREQAQQWREKLKRSTKKVNRREVQVAAVEVGEVSLLENISGIFVAESMPQFALDSLVQTSRNRGALLFSPFNGDVEKGVMVGLDVRSKIRPYLNLPALDAAGLSCNAVLVRMSRTIE